MSDLTLDPTTTALVLIDLQRGIASTATAPHTAGDVIARATRLARRFRERQATVVLVRVDPGPHWELFPRVAADVPRPMPPGAMPADWAQLVPELG
ncbi:MAG: isochorismatase family protein, partial [Gemmatimonadaceae bacterium]